VRWRRNHAERHPQGCPRLTVGDPAAAAHLVVDHGRGFPWSSTPRAPLASGPRSGRAAQAGALRTGRRLVLRRLLSGSMGYGFLSVAQSHACRLNPSRADRERSRPARVPLRLTPPLGRWAGCGHSERLDIDGEKRRAFARSPVLRLCGAQRDGPRPQVGRPPGAQRSALYWLPLTRSAATTVPLGNRPG